MLRLNICDACDPEHEAIRTVTLSAYEAYWSRDSPRFGLRKRNSA
jgi:hypothetical protein